MMDSKNLALPVGDNTAYEPQSGLTIREYFAIRILQGMMTTPDNLACRKMSAELAIQITDHFMECLKKTASEKK